MNDLLMNESSINEWIIPGINLFIKNGGMIINRYWILDTGYWILMIDTGYWILDTGC
eukprot:SAG11_NODE_17223_length_524_cov_3.616471_1_plen_56_part_01